MITQKGKVYVLRVTDKDGLLTVLTSSNYDALLVEGMELAKEKQGTWTIFNSVGEEVDGGRKATN